jgi:hypothetical protein
MIFSVLLRYNTYGCVNVYVSQCKKPAVSVVCRLLVNLSYGCMINQNFSDAPIMALVLCMGRPPI